MKNCKNHIDRLVAFIGPSAVEVPELLIGREGILDLERSKTKKTIAIGSFWCTYCPDCGGKINKQKTKRLLQEMWDNKCLNAHEIRKNH